MRLLFLIITILFSCFCYAQTSAETPVEMYKKEPFDSVVKKFDGLKAKQQSPKVDSMDLKVISMRELATYLDRINLISQKQFDLTEVKKYEQILRMIQSVYSEADRKRRTK